MGRKFRGTLIFMVLLALVLVAAPSRVMAQTQTTAADIQRLQDSATVLDGEIARLRTQDARLADELASALAGLREEITYLKVKFRKDGSVPRVEFLAVQDRLEALRGRAAGTHAAPAGGPINEVPAGTELDVRLQTPLSSKTARVEDRFEATTATDLLSGNAMLIPAGAVMRGVVSAVSKATRLDRKGSLALRFTEITVDGTTYPANATLTQVLESEGIKGEAGRIGTGAGVGAVIGGILGGFRGVLAGILIGAGGTLAATPGKDVELAPGTILRVRIDSPLLLK